MSLEIKTDNETEWRELTITEFSNTTFLFYRGLLKSYFHFSYRDKTKDNKFVGYGGTSNTKGEDDDSFDSYPKDVDIYITSNGMKNPFKRTKDQLINIQNLVIDIDSHESNLTIEELQKHIKDFETQLIDKLIIKPNFINETGRGIQLWYCIEPCHVSLDKTCLSVIDMLCNHIQEIMTELNETELTIDRTSSLKLNGLFRLPYSYNTKSKTWCEGKLFHENEPHIDKLYRKLKKKGYNSQYFGDKKEQSKTQTKKYAYHKNLKDNDYTPCLFHRKKFMDYLFKTRDIKVGSRNIMIFGMYSTLIQLMNDEMAQEYCTKLNNDFSEPLDSYELKSIFKEVDKKQHRFTVQKFFDFINVTEEEKEYFYESTLKKEKQKQRRKEKQDRNEKIIELHKQGTTIVEISKMMNVSRPTIYKVLNEKK